MSRNPSFRRRKSQMKMLVWYGRTHNSGASNNVVERRFFFVAARMRMMTCDEKKGRPEEENQQPAKVPLLPRHTAAVCGMKRSRSRHFRALLPLFFGSHNLFPRWSIVLLQHDMVGVWYDIVYGIVRPRPKTPPPLSRKRTPLYEL